MVRCGNVTKEEKAENMNEHLIGIPDGDKNAAVSLDMRGYQPSAGGSGHVPEGAYEAIVRSAAWKAKKSGEGKNLWMELRVSGPSKFEGTPLRCDHPAPIGNQGEKPFDAGTSFLKQIAFSVLTGLGKQETATNPTAGPFTFIPAKLEGKTLYVQVEDDEYEGKVRSKVARYITKEEYEKSPGPRSFAGATATDTTQRPASGGGVKAEPKEVLPANGAASTPTAVSDAALGF